jgi:hypothetical protein
MIAMKALEEQKILRELPQITQSVSPKLPPSSEAVVENSIMQWHCALARVPVNACASNGTLR